MVDTAAAEFPARSPYYYLSRGETDEMRKPPNSAVVVVGSGPIRIGQGIEFDYSCVHAAWALRDAGRSAVVVNNNPETVSTDFDISDVLVFEPPGPDEVESAYRSTGAEGVMLAFGGQTAINLAEELARRGVTIIGSDRRSLDLAEDREKFDAALERLGVARPQGRAAKTFREARAIARELGFPGHRAAVVRAGRTRHGDRAQRGATRVVRRERAADHARRAAAGRQVLARSRSRSRRGRTTARISSFPGSSSTSSGRASIRAIRSRFSRPRPSAPRWKRASSR